MRLIIYTLILSSLLSCSLIDYNIAPENLEVNYENNEALLLKPYVDRFLEEASRRGVRLHHKKIDIMVRESEDPDVLAKACFYCRSLKVYNNTRVWREMQGLSYDPDYGVGMKLLAHELSHTLLNHDHRGYKGETMQVILDDQETEALISIMTQGDNDIPNLKNHELSELWETYYWDELFGIIPMNRTFVVD